MQACVGVSVAWLAAASGGVGLRRWCRGERARCWAGAVAGGKALANVPFSWYWITRAGPWRRSGSLLSSPLKAGALLLLLLLLWAAAPPMP